MSEIPHDRWGFCIPRPDGAVDITVGPEVRPDHREEMDDVMAVIIYLQPMLIAFDSIERNYVELVEGLRLHEVQMHDRLVGGLPSIQLALEGLSLASQKLGNFLSAGTAFLNQASRRIKKQYLEEADAFAAWDLERTTLHKSNFSFRFLYALRNYAQHAGLPITNFNMSGERASEREPMRLKMSLQIERAKLLSESYNWSKQLKDEIECLPEEFDVMPMVTEYLHCLRSICLFCLRMEGPRLARAARYVQTVRRVFHVPDGAIPVWLDTSIIPPSVSGLIPVDQVQWVMKYFERLMNAVYPQEGSV